VTLVVADGRGNELSEGVAIVDVGRPMGRFDRMMRGAWRVLESAVALDADIYHFHDPELLLAGLRLKRLGKKVIFDSHEDVPRQIHSKTWIPGVLRGWVADLVERLENFVARRLDAIIAATPHIRDRFLRLNVRSVDINNFPLPHELSSPVPWENRRPQVCYVGGISRARGAMGMVAALEYTGSRLILAGNFMEAGLEETLQGMPGWHRVDYLGFLKRDAIQRVLAESKAGLVVLEPTRAYWDSLPVKMFEYMSAGLPVIASNFPLWKEIVEGNGCGLCIDPANLVGIGKAIDYILNNDSEARRMGENGRRAVLERYHWEREEDKLLKLYRELVDQ
jgi:hypothetical protein